jgi:hypothetical protein
MSDDATITLSLAGTEYVVKRLRLKQLRAIDEAMTKIEAGLSPAGAAYERRVMALAAALSVDHPQMTAAALWELPISREEFQLQSDKVLIFSGAKAQEKPAGEASAGISTTGAGSTDA